MDRKRKADEHSDGAQRGVGTICARIEVNLASQRVLLRPRDFNHRHLLCGAIKSLATSRPVLVGLAMKVRPPCISSAQLAVCSARGILIIG